MERGTFSHRHHVLHDQKVDQKTYNPLDNLSDKVLPFLLFVVIIADMKTSARFHR